MNGSVGDFASRWKVDYATASGLIKFLVAQGHAQSAGSRPSAAGKGKPSNLYTLPESVTLNLKGE